MLRAQPIEVPATNLGHFNQHKLVWIGDLNVTLNDLDVTDVRFREASRKNDPKVR